MKKYLEMRAAKVAEMKALVDSASVETRSLTDEEAVQIEELKKAIAEIDRTIEAIKAAHEADIAEGEAVAEEAKAEETEAEETRALASVIRGEAVETRAITGTGLANAGAVVRQTLAKRVIDKAKDICPFLELAQIYNVDGKLSIPYVDTEGSDSEFAVVSDLDDIKDGKIAFKTIDLDDVIAAVNYPVSKTLINSSDIDIVNFVVDTTARKFAEYVDAAIVKGNAKVKGLTTLTNTKATAAQGVISIDDMVTVVGTLPTAYKTNAVWIMHPQTLTALKKLKDGDGRPLFTSDLAAGFGDKILGYTVYTSEHCPIGAEANEVVAYFGNLRDALAIKLGKGLEVEVLKEAYAKQYAIGISATVSMDAKIQNEQAIVALVNAAS